MALPAGLYVGKPVNYLPNLFDATVWSKGLQIPVAALITDIDAANNTVSLVAFPKGSGPFFRNDIKYYTDTANDENGFKLDTDTLTCGTDVSAAAVVDTNYNNFVITFTQPAGNHGYLVFYRVTGSGTWLTPNQPGNATADLIPGQATLAGLADATSYDVLIQNICNNGVAAAGVTVTDTTTTPL